MDGFLIKQEAQPVLSLPDVKIYSVKEIRIGRTDLIVVSFAAIFDLAQNIFDSHAIQLGQSD